MFDIYGNPPNHPVLMRLPPPTAVSVKITAITVSLLSNDYCINNESNVNSCRNTCGKFHT